MPAHPVARRLLDFGFQNPTELWRSEEMQLVQLMLPSEAAYDIVHALGDVGLLQFKDLNADKSAFQRTYASQVKRCDEMARRLRFFQEQVEKAGLAIRPSRPSMLATSVKTVTFDELEAKLEELEKECVETNNNMERLLRSYAELVEMQLVLEKGGTFFDSRSTSRIAGAASSMAEDGEAPLLEAPGGDKVAKVGFVAGTIAKDKVIAFERLLFRATRGNMLLKQSEVGKIKDPATGESVEKVVFCVFFAGERAAMKINKICEVYNANKYPFPEDIARQRQMATEVSGRLRELQTTNEAGERRRDAMLRDIALSIDDWVVLARKEKAVYHTLNKLSIDVTSKVLIAEAWVPSYAKQQVQDVLARIGLASHTQLSAVMHTLPTHDQPPTHYRTNKFTHSFQAIVEAYGVARYREVNPTVLTLMTFPFLFAVMFGDVGHAVLMLAFALFLIINERKMATQDLGDMVGMLFGGRYVILLMGLYSIYTGLMYNEFFAVPMAIFGTTHWGCLNATIPGSPPPTVTTWTSPHDIDVRNCQPWGGEIEMAPGSLPYVFGVDPIWHGRKTELPFLNSMKMKMSILLGVTHMDFGILNSLFNNLHFRDMVSVWWEFIPQMVFLNFIFGYLAILIVTKWATGSMADLYHVMIAMFLTPGTVDEAGYIFPGQAGLQVFLVLVALVAVPCMLLPKPLILKKRHEAAKRSRGEVELVHGASYEAEEGLPLRGGGGDHGSGGHGDHGHGEFDFGEIMVHQMIHTIEFVLGAVSNTASYLRLWALSLAHSQLSSVFFDRVLMAAVQTANIGACIIGFFVFACATLGVLMVMESLSAFLHALRLHWVEYQGKFYKGDGYKFAPFDFRAILETPDEEEK